MEFVATCLFGLESLLGKEIDALGYERLDTMDGRITFRGDAAAAARCSLFLRYAERLYLKLGDFHAESFEELFDGVNALPLEAYIGKEDRFPVKGHSIKSKLTSLPACQSIIKKAAAKRLGDAWGCRWLPETGILYQLEFFLFKDHCTLMIDTSGVPLHKRGYRPAAGEAPLRETLAAALAAIARPREEVLFWDPMCGSGTIPIEAAMLMTNTAPGLSRRFAAEAFPVFPEALWKSAREEAFDSIRKDSRFEAYASDIDPHCVEIAAGNVKRAGIEAHVRVFQKDALTVEKGDRRGTVVCNPPYGERLSTPEECRRLYTKMGERFRALAPWQVYILCSDEEFERYYGGRADKVRRLYNGMLRCGLYQYFKRREKVGG